MPAVFSFARLLRRRSVSAGLVGLGVIALVCCLYVRQPVVLQQMDNRIYDLLMTSRPVQPPSDVPVIIDIDEASLRAYGQWPWPRYQVARLVGKLVENGAAAVGVDVLLAEPDRSSPESMRANLLRDMGVTVHFEGLPQNLIDYDSLLAAELNGLPVVLGMYAGFGEAPLASSEGTVAETENVLPPPVGSVEQRSPDAPPQYELTRAVHSAGQATVPLAVFWENAPVGLINMSPDSDGFVRRVPMISYVRGKLYANLGLRTLMTAMGQRNVFASIGADGLESLRVGDIRMPVTPSGDLIVNYQGPRETYPYVSAKDVLDGTLPPGAFEGKILFVGTSAPGLLDIRSTPYDRVYPGVEVHAAVLDSMLTQRFMTVPPWTPGLQMFVIILSGIACVFAFGFARPRVYVLVGVVLLGGAAFGSWHFFQRGVFVSPLYAGIAIVALAVLLLVLRFWLEERQKIVLRQAFSRYVAPEVVKRITERGGDIFAGEERELSIMFTDIRGFTSLSEKLAPPQVVSLLNQYFTPMTAIVRNSGGTLDKFIGDALMAFWNAPVSVEHHAVRAVETALRMQEELARLNVTIRNEFGCTLEMGVGINTGKAYVGNMGSADLVNYTLIGDNVNLASRLEGLCSKFGVGTVVSEHTRDACLGAAHDIAFQLLDTLRVKGRVQPVSVYVAMPHTYWEEHKEELGLYDAAIGRYRNGDFRAAHAAFERLEARYGRKTLYDVYRERLDGLLAEPPLQWDGVWTLDSK